MQGLRAFVGHSFVQQDETVVQKFLDYLNTLKTAHLGFTWDHARSAEPLQLHEKVLAKIEGKNVFIGICTANERAVRQNALEKGGWLAKGKLIAREEDFQWKTSDWLIQEIGLAVGRNMRIILLLERGLRPPGGLYGTLEYIPFDRDKPEGSFNPLLQMLIALAPSEITVGTTAPEPEATKGEEVPADAAAQDWMPKLDWTLAQYERALLRAIFSKRTERLQTISEAYSNSIHAQGSALAEWRAKLEWYKWLHDGSGDLEKVKALADENPRSATLWTLVAGVHRELDDEQGAAKAFEQAAGAADSVDDRVKYETGAAIAYAESGEGKKALDIFESVKRLVADSIELQIVTLEQLKEFAKIEKDDELELAALERLCELKPTDMSIRFQVAYKHSQAGNQDMCMHHYLKIPVSARHGSTWNNLGVVYQHFSMPIRSVEAYKRSERAGETLAMSNIGNKLLGAGFVDEAQERAMRAVLVPEYHANINDLLKRLREAPEEEKEKEIELLSKVQEKAIFYQRAGAAAFNPKLKEVAGKWEGPQVVLSAMLEDSAMKLTGSYEEEEMSLGRLARFGLLEGSSAPGGSLTKKVRRTVTYTMRVRGEMLIGEVTRTGAEPAGLFGLGISDTSKVLMYFERNGREIRVMEGIKFFSIKAIENVLVD